LKETNKILLKILFFFLPIIIVLGYLEVQLRSHHFSSSYAAKKYFLEQQLYSVETLVLGSSESFNGIDPTYFSSKTFNLANVSQTLFYDKALTLNYVAQMPKLKNVIINISYFSFFYQLHDIKEKWRDDYYKLYFDIDFPENKNFTINKYSYVAVYQLKHSIELAFNKFKDSSAIHILPNGYMPKWNQELINNSTGLARVTIHHNEIFEDRRKEIEKSLEDFVQQLKRNNINIIFITTPVFKTYSKFCNPKIIEQNVEFIHHLSSTYQCKYLNYFTDSSFIKDDFFDNDHLNNSGAKKLSIKLNEELNNKL
jgi:hypothetical protein